MRLFMLFTSVGHPIFVLLKLVTMCYSLICSCGAKGVIVS